MTIARFSIEKIREKKVKKLYLALVTAVVPVGVITHYMRPINMVPRLVSKGSVVIIVSAHLFDLSGPAMTMRGALNSKGDEEECVGKGCKRGEFLKADGKVDPRCACSTEFDPRDKDPLCLSSARVRHYCKDTEKARSA